MKHLKTSILAAAVMLPALYAGQVALAAPVFGPNGALQSIEAINYENNYRSDASCAANPGTCLGAVNGAPAGYQLVDGSLAGNILVGDLFAGIINLRIISNSTTGTTWVTDPIGGPVGGPGTQEFTGFFLNEVKSVTAPPDPFDPTAAQIADDHIQLGAASVADPFGVLAPGDLFRLYVDDTNLGGPGTLFNFDGQPVGFFGAAGTDIGDATDGTLWASLGIGVGLCDEPACTTGFLYTHSDSSTNQANFADESFLGLNSLIQGPAYNLGNLVPINDPTDNETPVAPGTGVPTDGGGGFATGPDTATCLPLGLLPILCTEFIASIELDANPESNTLPGGSGTSPWGIRSNDPIELITIGVPEPGMVALMGLGLLGLAGFRRQRRA